MKQINFLKLTVVAVSSVLLLIAVYLVISVASHTAIPFQMGIAFSPDKAFLEANPEIRYAQQMSDGLAQSSLRYFQEVNPESHFTHLDPAELDTYLDQAYLATNPEARFAAKSIVSITKDGNENFFEANPELAFNLRYLEAKGSESR